MSELDEIILLKDQNKQLEKELYRANARKTANQNSRQRWAKRCAELERENAHLKLGFTRKPTLADWTDEQILSEIQFRLYKYRKEAQPK